ncbi:pentapeptide repeat-containing protein [Nocardia gipuzkoensis]
MAKANLSGAILTGADLTGAYLAEVIYNESTISPTGFEPPQR